MTQDAESTHPDGASPPANGLAAALKERLPFLKDAALADDDATAEQTAEVLAIVVELLSKLEQTMQSQLEVLGKQHAPIRTMIDSAQNQGLISIEKAIIASLKSSGAKPIRLKNYSELLLRWWSALLTGVQTTVMEAPEELAQALNPSNWDVERKRWASEAEVHWKHFKFVIRPDVPAAVGDRLKAIQAEKTLEAYCVLGAGPGGEKSSD